MKKQIADIVTVVFSMAGSLLISSNIGLNSYGYAAFLVGGVAAWYLLKQCNASWSLKFTTLFFFCSNTLGFCRYLGG